MAEQYDTIVIGAGMSGLAAGIRLAQYDQRVVVLDRHSLWGGLNSFYKKKGRRFDVGLHALTNYVPKGTKGRPLTRILRQLRIPYDALQLGEQTGSRVSFPGVSLRWTNDFEVLRAEIADKFPGQIDGFDRLVRDIAGYPDLVDVEGEPPMARDELSAYITDQTLVEMLLLPLLYYGSRTPRRRRVGLVRHPLQEPLRRFSRLLGGRRAPRARLVETASMPRRRAPHARVADRSRRITKSGAEAADS